MKHKVGQTGKALDMEWKDWYKFEVTEVREDFEHTYYIVFKILDWEHKGKYSFIESDRLDDTIIFD